MLYSQQPNGKPKKYSITIYQEEDILRCKNCHFMRSGSYSPYCSALGTYSLKGEIPFIGDVTYDEGKRRSDCPLKEIENDNQ